MQLLMKLPNLLDILNVHAQTKDLKRNLWSLAPRVGFEPTGPVRPQAFKAYTVQGYVCAFVLTPQPRLQ